MNPIWRPAMMEKGEKTIFLNMTLLPPLFLSICLWRIAINESIQSKDARLIVLLVGVVVKSTTSSSKKELNDKMSQSSWFKYFQC